MTGFIAILLIFLSLLFVDFLFTAGLVWLVCFAFGFIFSWKLVLGVWVIIAILHSIFGTNVHVNKD